MAEKLTDKERAERFKMALLAIYISAGSADYSTVKTIARTALEIDEDSK